ncbi:hypothetical protein AAB988_29655 [Burkholderia contaminans]|uniref:hypothetical protein n=1 Tax=Burkholderia contaminans TaxID=488447 RepID=UPI00310F05EF
MNKTLTDEQIRAFAESACDHEVGAGALRQNVATVDNVILAIRNALKLATQQPEPRASASVIAAAIAVIKADRAHVLTDEHIDALDIAIKIQQGMFKVPEPRDEVTEECLIELAIFHKILGIDGNGDATRSYGGRDDVLNLCRAVASAARRVTPDRAAIIEECAKVCEGDGEAWYETPDTWGWHAKDYARAIRALKTAPIGEKK